MIDLKKAPKRLGFIGQCLLFVVVCGVNAFPTGDIPAGACTSMVPNHGVAAQTSTPPYIISFTPSTYSAGSTVTVTLRACSTAFRGFLIEARRALSTANQAEALGSFTPVTNTRRPSACANTLAHSNNEDKYSMTFVWTAPATPEGHLDFRVTFVQATTTFWTNVISDILQDSSIGGPFDPTNLDTPTTQPSACNPRLEISADCGTSVGCYSSCTLTDCDFTVAWREDSGFGIYTISTKTTETRPWMAIAFSSDQLMGSDSVSGCLTANDGSINVFNGENTGRISPTIFTDTNVTLTSSLFANGILTCTIRRLATASADGRRFDITQNYYLFLARGATSGTDTIGYHQAANRFISPQEFTVTDTTTNIGGPPQLDVLEISADCGTSMGCYSSCTQTDCDFTVSWMEASGFGIYTLKLKTTAARPWMAIAFSSDQQMGSDSVSGCLTANDGSINVFNGENTGRIPPTMFTDTDVTLTSSLFNNGILTCTIRRLATASADGRRFDITQSHYLFFASGITNATDTIGYHGLANRFFSPQEFTVTDTTVNIGGPPTAGSINLPSDCGTARGCFSRCDGTSCTFIISWTENATSGIYTLTHSSGDSSPWIAMAWSSDDEMGGDHVIGCAGSSTDGSVNLFNGEITGKRAPTQFTDNAVVLESSSFQDGVLSCTFARPKAASADGRRFNIDQAWNILVAYESATISGSTVSLSYHGTNRFASSSAYTVSDTPNEGASSLDYPLIKAHGTIMIGAWIFFASIGIVIARHYKPVWTVTLFSQQIWFQVHRACMVLVFAMTVIGFILIFAEVEEWSDLEEPDGYLDAHPIIGVIVTILTVINPVMALIRPHPGTKYRPIFNWAHWAVGMAAHILGVIAIFFGVQLAKADSPDYLVRILGAYVAWQMLVMLVLELLPCVVNTNGDCSVKPEGESYDMDNSSGELTAPKKISESGRAIFIKRIILVIHTVVTGALSLTLIIVVGSGDSD